ncbi:hypothetical protein ACFLU1_04355 [Chloroflexota bacterium]
MRGRQLHKGEGRTRICLTVESLGDDTVVCIYNKSAHIGAVAVGDYDLKEDRTSVSVITRSGHKDDTIAQRAAYLISKHTKNPSCVIAGVHLDNISTEEIQKLVVNSEMLVNEFLKLHGSTNIG